MNPPEKDLKQEQDKDHDQKQVIAQTKNVISDAHLQINIQHTKNAKNLNLAPVSSLKPSSNTINDTATSMSFLVSDWSQFGLSERTFYHFDLIGNSHNSNVVSNTTNKITLTSNSNHKPSSSQKDDDLLKNRTAEQKAIANQSIESKHIDNHQHGKSNIRYSSTNHHYHHSHFCGISSLLECVPYTPLNKRTKRYRRYFRERYRDFNLQAFLHREKRQLQHQQQIDNIEIPTQDMMDKDSQSFPLPIECHRPTILPLPISHMTRVTFAYELTKMVICIDASPTLTSTFGNYGMAEYQNHHESEMEPYYCCAMDRIGPMLQKYLKSLLTPIPVTATDGVVKGGNWIPEIAITVIAVYNGSDESSPYKAKMKQDEHLNVHRDNENNFDNNNVGNNEISDLNSQFVSNNVWNLRGSPYSNKFSVLVKDHRIKDMASAEALSNKISKWAITEVENDIAARLSSSTQHISSYRNNSTFYSPYTQNALFHSDLREMLNISALALDVSLPKKGRPLILVVSDCRSIFCGNIIDFIGATHTKDDYSTFRSSTPTFPPLVDVPIHILNIRPPSSSPSTNPTLLPSSPMQPKPVFTPPLISDDTEALYSICEASHGCFLNSQILHELSQTIVGQVPISSPLHADNFVSLRKRNSMRPNTLQWYTLFTLSFLTPLMNHSARGWMSFLSTKDDMRQDKGSDSGVGVAGVPDEIDKSGFGDNKTGLERNVKVDNQNFSQSDAKTGTIPGAEGQKSGITGSKKAREGEVVSIGSTLSKRKKSPVNINLPPIVHNRPSFDNIVIHSYSLSNIRIKGLLNLRAQQNFRAKYFGGDDGSGKMLIHFTLPMDLELTLHYELSFTPTIAQKVGWAQIKLFLDGEVHIVHDVKNEFLARLLSGQKSHNQQNLHGSVQSLSHQHKTRHFTVASLVSSKICKFLNFIKREDELEKELCALDENDLMESKESKFLQLLDSLRLGPRHRHFRVQTVDLVCSETMDMSMNEESICGNDTEVNYTGTNTVQQNVGEFELRNFLENSWAHFESKKKLYVRIISTAKRYLEAYCVVDIQQSKIASKLYHINIYLCGTDIEERLKIIHPLLKSLIELKHVIVIPNSIKDYYLAIKSYAYNERVEKICHTPSRKSFWIENFRNHAHWELDRDPNLLLLLIRRRKELEKFWVIESSSSHAILAKLVHVEDREFTNSQIYLVQSQLYSDSHKVIVNFQMDIPNNSFYSICGHNGRLETVNPFNDFLNEMKLLDEKCAVALRSRRRLISMFDPHLSQNCLQEFQEQDVQHLLPYSSRLTMRLRFFHSSASAANDILSDLTTRFLLSLEDQGKKHIIKLGINQLQRVNENMDRGAWLLMYHNTSTHSIIHFPYKIYHSPLAELNIDLDERDEYVYRELSVFTFRICDLYSSSGHNHDHNSSNRHQFDQIYEFREKLQNEHELNYSRASFLALRRMDVKESISFQPNDFRYALSPTSEVEIANSFITQMQSVRSENVNLPRVTESSEEESSGLSVIISSLFQPVPGGYPYFYFSGKESEDLDFETKINDTIQVRLIRENILELDLEDSNDENNHDDVPSENDERNIYENTFFVKDKSKTTSEFLEKVMKSSTLGDKHEFYAKNPPPIFVKFLFDGQIAEKEDLASESKSANLKAFITTFKSETCESLPQLHACVSLALRNNLEAYVASLTLQRLNRLKKISSTISEIDLMAAMKCLVVADSVSSHTIPLKLFSSKFDSIGILSNPNDAEMNDAYSRLYNEISSRRFITLLELRYDTYYITSMEEISGPFWAFVQIHQMRGFISILVYHSSGIQAAQDAKEKISNAIQKNLSSRQPTSIVREYAQFTYSKSLHD